MILSRREKRRWKNKYWIAACERRVGREAAEVTGGWTREKRGQSEEEVRLGKIVGSRIRSGLGKESSTISFVRYCRHGASRGRLVASSASSSAETRNLLSRLLFIGCKVPRLYVSIS